ncbi:cytochrome c biogenesis protein ResB [Streptomyces sp. ST2-7A]|uniref:cytochrome c biogenesis protein ResB n=1 Tax=Streptomyces sp. ST2-7A TaxID=2907214 RepID=UPI001F3FCF2C|nr:cytochrome c biogenesis protein ResB [Streptomyces sp. ST2-7A]MCE7080298.1 cytochrome c biogenesis protein ResB [Streptomyces sp. ST2-7A]
MAEHRDTGTTIERTPGIGEDADGFPAPTGGPEGHLRPGDGGGSDGPGGSGDGSGGSGDGSGDDGPAGSGSFGGAREPGARGALTWLGREVLGWGRWYWRQLTSMRTALILLFLLALASIPGSLIPQETGNPAVLADFHARHGTLAAVYERLQLFNVYSSVWFSAIYILLFVSLIGCIVPRTWQFIGQLRSRPPRAPRRLDRMPASVRWRTDAEPAAVLEAAHGELRRRRFRTVREGDADGGGPVGATGTAGAHPGAVAAEKGYLREAGNLLFHVALVVMLIAFAAGQLYRSEGGKLIVVGSGFTNTLTQYDDFGSGALFDIGELERFRFDLDGFHASFAREGPDLGTPREFRADVTYWRDGDTEGTEAAIEVNHPLTVGDAKVYLISHGFAPVVTVTDGQGETAFTGPVPFLPQDMAGTATGVIKVTDYLDENGEPDQLGFQGIFSPTYRITADRGPHSSFPDPDHPVLTLTAYRGNLGLNAGIPQNVYQLDTSRMEQFLDASGEPRRISMEPGDTWELPDGKGSLTFEGFERWAGFQISTPAANGWALAGAVGAVLGLAASLLIQRRRVWVRTTVGPDGRTLVEMGSLGRTESSRIPEELGELAAVLSRRAPALPDDAEPAPTGGGDAAGPVPATVTGTTVGDAADGDGSAVSRPATATGDADTAAGGAPAPRAPSDPTHDDPAGPPGHPADPVGDTDSGGADSTRDRKEKSRDA